MITTTTELVSAEQAKLWLGLNTNNRPVSRNHVTHYAAQMVSGKWGVTAQPLQFGEDDKLLDGQHRLMALIKADEKVPGIAVAFQVARGVPSEGFKYIDIGKARTAKDALALAGYSNATNLAAATTAHMRLKEQDWAGRLPDNDGILAHLEAHPKLVEAMPLAAVVQKRLQKPSTFVALCVHAMERGVSYPELYAFADSIRTGVNLNQGSPALALREWADLQARNQRAVPHQEYAYVMFRALHAYIHGKQLRRLGSSVGQKNDGLSFDVEQLAQRGRGRK